MATFAAAVTEQQRLQREYTGVTGRVEALSGAFGVRIHDVRAGEARSGQTSLVPLFQGWSALVLEPGVIQIAYT